MQIVIDIPEETYKGIMIGKWDGNGLAYYVKEGIILPKGHGRLVDISKIDKDKIESDNPILHLTVNGEYTEAISLQYLDDLTTIIEADKESEDKE